MNIRVCHGRDQRQHVVAAVVDQIGGPVANYFWSRIADGPEVAPCQLVKEVPAKRLYDSRRDAELAIADCTGWPLATAATESRVLVPSPLDHAAFGGGVCC